MYTNVALIMSIKSWRNVCKIYSENYLESVQKVNIFYVKEQGKENKKNTKSQQNVRKKWIKCLQMFVNKVHMMSKKINYNYFLGRARVWNFHTSDVLEIERASAASEWDFWYKKRVWRSLTSALPMK